MTHVTTGLFQCIFEHPLLGSARVSLFLFGHCTVPPTSREHSYLRVFALNIPSMAVGLSLSDLQIAVPVACP